MSEDLKAYLDGELTPDRVAAVQKALETSPKLRLELEQLRAIRSVLRGSESPVVSKGLQQTLVALSRKPALPWFFARPSLGLSAAALAAATVFAVWNLTGQSELTRGAVTATEMGAADRLPKLRSAAEAMQLDNGEVLPPRLVPLRSRSFDMQAQSLKTGLETVKLVAEANRGSIVKKEESHGIVRISVQVPTESVEAFLQGLDVLAGKPKKPAGPATAPSTRSTGAREREPSGVSTSVVEVILRLKKEQ